MLNGLTMQSFAEFEKLITPSCLISKEGELYCTFLCLALIETFDERKTKDGFLSTLNESSTLYFGHLCLK